MSGDLASMAHGIYRVGITISPRAERALLDWILVNFRLCTFMLNGFNKVKHNRYGERYSLVISAHAAADAASDEKDTFYRTLSGLIQPARPLDILI